MLSSFFFLSLFLLLVSQITWMEGERGWLAEDPVPPTPSQLSDMERVAGRHVVGHLGLEAVDVAAVAEQVALQRVAAVALLIVQHQAAVLPETQRHEPHEWQSSGRPHWTFTSLSLPTEEP